MGAVRPARVLYVLYLYSLCGLVLSTVGRAFVSIWLVRVLRPADRSFTPLGAGLRAVGPWTTTLTLVGGSNSPVDGSAVRRCVGGVVVVALLAGGLSFLIRTKNKMVR